MKKLFFTAAALLTLTAGAATADLFTMFKNANLEPKPPVAAYRVETQGLDVRVYEWTLVTNPNMVCVMAWGQTHPAGLQCVSKTEEK